MYKIVYTIIVFFANLILDILEKTGELEVLKIEKISEEKTIKLAQETIANMGSYNGSY